MHSNSCKRALVGCKMLTMLTILTFFEGFTHNLSTLANRT